MASKKSKHIDTDSLMSEFMNGNSLVTTNPEVLPGQMEIQSDGGITETDRFYTPKKEERKEGRKEETKEDIFQDLYTPTYEVNKEEIKEDRRLSMNIDIFPYNLKGIKRLIVAKSDRGEKVKQWQIVNKAIEEYLTKEFKKL